MVKKHAVLLVLLLLAACSIKSITPDTPAQVDPREQDARSIAAEAEPLAGTILAGLAAGDYAAYSRDFDETLRYAITAEKFAVLKEKFAKTIGVYEAGKSQVNKIETYSACYKIYYFVKFSRVQAADPVIMTVKVVKTQSGLKVSDLTYSHALLGM
ncbi:MAG: hypothetical protein JW832_08775 [Deltaproteobacteria bacterium]|nr:hypothetical protein [Deltaproteobacteria bacterium]